METKYARLRTDMSVARTRKDISATLRKWGVADGNYDLRIGLRDAEVIWTVNGKEQRFKCSRFAAAEQNLRAIFLALDATRLAAQRGILEELAQIAVAMLPAGKIRRPPHEALEVAENASIEVAEAAYRAKAKTAHPDAGGTNDAMLELNEAIAFYRQR